MDHVDGDIPGDGSGAGTRDVTQPTSSAWERYYAQASRRRRSHHSRRRLREEKRRRRLRERIGLGLSALLVAGMTMIFYLVLTR